MYSTPPLFVTLLLCTLFDGLAIKLSHKIPVSLSFFAFVISMYLQKWRMRMFKFLNVKFGEGSQEEKACVLLMTNSHQILIFEIQLLSLHVQFGINNNLDLKSQKAQKAITRSKCALSVKKLCK